MKVIVIGDGKVGRTIVEHTCQEGHEVAAITILALSAPALFKMS